jgi:hypothetical protein
MKENKKSPVNRARRLRKKLKTTYLYFGKFEFFKLPIPYLFYLD